MKAVDKVLNGFHLLKVLLEKTTVIGVSLKLPRFKIESQMDLIKYMRSLGINDLFDPGLADLSG